MSQNPFCTSYPKLQRAWDATSLGALMFCPRYYEYTIIEGYRQSGNLDLEFGGFFASAVERYRKGRINGETKEQATIATLRDTLLATYTDAGPWSGQYVQQWRCTGTTPYRNAKGNRAKCPWSHAGVWSEGIAPETCGACGSPTETDRRWVGLGTKDRYALIRLVSAYCDSQPETPADGPWPIQFGDGTPAVELSFRMPLMRNTPDNEPYLLCGHLDSIVSYGQEHFIDDNKTTTKLLNDKYWNGYSPNIQVDAYDLAGSLLWPSLNLRVVLIEAAQITKESGLRLGMRPMRRSEEHREELLRDLEYWLSQAERFASEDYWPMNRRNCWLCPFNTICSKAPSKRKQYLESNFEKRKWNPLEER